VEGQFAIKLENDHASVFNYIQELVLRMRRQSRTDKEAEIDQAHERGFLFILCFLCANKD
jgi:hypothetical protein